MTSKYVGLPRSQPWKAWAGLVLAGAASMATSGPAWSLEADLEGPRAPVAGTVLRVHIEASDAAEARITEASGLQAWLNAHAIATTSAHLGLPAASAVFGAKSSSDLYVFEGQRLEGVGLSGPGDEVPDGAFITAKIAVLPAWSRALTPLVTTERAVSETDRTHHAFVRLRTDRLARVTITGPRAVAEPDLVVFVKDGVYELVWPMKPSDRAGTEWQLAISTYGLCAEDAPCTPPAGTELEVMPK